MSPQMYVPRGYNTYRKLKEQAERIARKKRKKFEKDTEYKTRIYII